MADIATARFPEPLLTTIVDDRQLSPPLLALCAGYERGEWRSEQFAEYLMNWLPDFVFPEEELRHLDTYSARAALRRSARLIYQTDKYRHRGEFGELLLHAILREHFGSLPAIRKIYFKDTPNDIVKGFDAVHVVATSDDLELWLGEVKFYTAIDAAITHVRQELLLHSQTDFLRTEFSLILNKLDRNFRHYHTLRRLLDPNSSLDEVFGRVRVPVLLTYDSATTQSFKRTCQEYMDHAKGELVAAHSAFARPGLPAEVIIHLILVPLATKSKLVQALQAKLEGQQR